MNVAPLRPPMPTPIATAAADLPPSGDAGCFDAVLDAADTLQELAAEPVALLPAAPPLPASMLPAPMPADAPPKAAATASATDDTAPAEAAPATGDDMPDDSVDTLAPQPAIITPPIATALQLAVPHARRPFVPQQAVGTEPGPNPAVDPVGVAATSVAPVVPITLGGMLQAEVPLATSGAAPVGTASLPGMHEPLGTSIGAAANAAVPRSTANHGGVEPSVAPSPSPLPIASTPTDQRPRDRDGSTATPTASSDPLIAPIMVAAATLPLKPPTLSSSMPEPAPRPAASFDVATPVDTTASSFRIDSAALGSVDVDIAPDQRLPERLAVHLAVERAATATLIADGSDRLDRVLAAAGARLDSLSVTTGPRGETPAGFGSSASDTPRRDTPHAPRRLPRPIPPTTVAACRDRFA